MNFDSVDGVFFDFGGVISVSPMAKWGETLYPFCESVGLSRDRVLEGFARYRRLWDGDEISFEDMYRRVFADAALPPPSDATLAEIRRFDAASWVDRFRPDTLELMKDLKGRGLRLGILSNMSSDFHRDFFAPKSGAYRELCDVEVISGFERVCKPDARIFAIAERRMGIPAARLAFLDDSKANVAAARSCGWQAEVYPDAD